MDRRSRWHLKHALVLGCLLLLRPMVTFADEAIDFSRDIRPILSQNCFKCHGVDDKGRKANLRLDDREAAIKPAKSGERAIVSGKPGDSELIKRINSKDEEEVMPPPAMKKELTEAQKALLKKWVEQGAEYKPHWAFVSPKQSPLPELKQKDWVRNPIDAFVLARLEKEGLKPSPAADKYTLIRRVYLDLIGLPPTPEEADAFVKDNSADAYEKLVDRLLASPQYGERWTRRWLDLARYADTNGYEKDRPRTIWPYRDWVIKAFNDDKPFDQFTVEQLAGDMLPNATADQKIATGFHRNTMRNEEGGIDPLEYRFYSMVDRVGTTGTTWLGLTVACAQCHTHKYDPIRHNEYYQLMAFLNNADEPEMDLPSPEVATKRAEILAKVEKLTSELPKKWPIESVEWEVATPANAKAVATGPAKLETSADESWRAEGPVSDVDNYTFTITSDLPRVDRLKLDALLDAPKVGPGRSPHGNFVLTQVTITAEPKDAPDHGKSVKITKATASYEQKGFPVTDALKGHKPAGWAVDGEKEQKDRTATFFFDEPITFGKGTKFTVSLDQQYGRQHTIGRLRLSLGGERKDPRPADVQRKEAIDVKFAQWLQREAPRAVKWNVLRPTSLKSNAPTLNLLPDDSVLASGDITKSDTYELGFDKLNAKGITAIRIEAIPHESLPKGGPGMVYYEGAFGDFSLSNITLFADGQKGKFIKAAASFATNNAGADRAIDDNLQTGWMINGGQGRPHTAVFALDKPTDAKDLKLDLLFEKYYAAALGHFRVSYTTDLKALDPIAQPPEVEAALVGAFDRMTGGADQRGVEKQEGSAADLAATLPPAERDVLFRRFLLSTPELATSRKEIDSLFRSLPSPQTSLVLTERASDHTRSTFVHNRGEFMQPTDAVKPGVPAFLPPLPPGASVNRLAFAKWLVSPENPLTARVTVNRQWQAFFGRGIVRTLEDFGFQGEQPTNPELLDWLAVEFMKQGWSLKKLNRLIVTSSVYRQSSAVAPELLSRDPQNTLLARGPRFRAEAEIVRDSALKASGLLSSKMGGPSVFPPQPASVTTEGAYGALTWTTSTGEDRYRRSLYTFTKRTAPFAMYGTFDAPSGEACVARREMSNTPLQALTLLNDTVFLESAQAMGKQVAAMQADDAAKVDHLFRRVLTRPPTEDEKKLLSSFVTTQRERFTKGELDAKKLVGSPDGSADQAAWTALARALMNLDEAVTKN